MVLPRIPQPHSGCPFGGGQRYPQKGFSCDVDAEKDIEQRQCALLQLLVLVVWRETLVCVVWTSCRKCESSQNLFCAKLPPCVAVVMQYLNGRQPTQTIEKQPFEAAKPGTSELEVTIHFTIRCNHVNMAST